MRRLACKPSVGVGGVSPRAFDVAAKSPATALSRLAEWRAGAATPATFPFSAVLLHFHATGRNHADATLIEALRAVARNLPADDGTVDAVLLSSWLPSTYDQRDGGYDTYACIPLLHGLAGSPATDSESVLDVEQVALLAALLEFEAMSAVNGAGGPVQRKRLAACARSLVRSSELAPGAQDTVPVSALREGGTGPDLSAGQVAGLAQEALAAVQPHVRHAVTIAMLPTTTLHDEVMFIRSIQIFELCYHQVARLLRQAVSAVEDGAPTLATVALREATARVTATGMLHRILTTMPREAFAVIRQHTRGRSAIQSRGYRDVEHWGQVLSEVSADVAAGELTAAMAELDGAWRAMKRTHWGITLKTIGSVPGTGGTAGAEYLAKSAARPLIPGRGRERGRDV